jgi:hypothetical protein
LEPSWNLLGTFLEPSWDLLGPFSLFLQADSPDEIFHPTQPPGMWHTSQLLQKMANITKPGAGVQYLPLSDLPIGWVSPEPIHGKERYEGFDGFDGFEGCEGFEGFEFEGVGEVGGRAGGGCGGMSACWLSRV